MKIATRLFLVACAALLTVATAAPRAHAIAVDLELSLVIDVSGSVDTTEYNLQMDGYADAFRSTTVKNAILAGNGIAVNAVFFSSSATEGVPFTLLNSEASILAFADVLDAFVRPSSGVVGTETDIHAGIDAAVATFGTETGGAANGFESPRQVIDVSGDGLDNDGSAPSIARDDALLAGVDVINGLAIEGDFGPFGVTNHYTANVIGGTGAFVITAEGFDDFATAVENKLVTEIIGNPNAVPEPVTASLGLLSLGALGMFATRRRKA